MSSSIHYRFRSSSEFETITFDGPSITVSDLRDAIMEQKKIAKTPGHTLEITNAQTKEVYQVDSNMVPKNSSVIVKRVPVQRLEAVTAATSGLSKEEEELTEIAFAKLSKTADLVNAKASENDKIKAMMKQSTDDFNPSQYSRRAPPNYPCYRCDGRGHFIKDCPTQGDPRYNNAQYAPRQPSGIPRAYYMMNLMRFKQEEELLKNLRAMQPANSRFTPVCSSDVVDQTKIPSELQCPMCKKLFTDVVVTPCCGFSYCDECIRNHLVEHDLVCVCKETTSPDNLIANKSLRTSVSNFRNKKNAEMKSVPPSPISAPPQSIFNGPHLTAEIISTHPAADPTIIQVQQPPDLSSENSQSSMANGLTGTESGQDSDTACVNSPKKVMLEGSDPANPLSSDATSGRVQSPVLSQQVVPAPTAQVVTSLPVTQPSMITSQVLSHPYPVSAAQAIYSGVQTAIRPGLMIPQQQRHMVPGTVVGPGPYGVSVPPGARIFKRLVPVPVGPRIPRNQIRMAQQQAHQLAAAGGINPHLMDPIRVPSELIKVNDKRRGNDVQSPIMPLTEDEFYLWQQQFKQRSTPSRRRQHRSTSRDGSRERERQRFRSRSRSRSSRSRSRSPPAEKKRRYRHKEEEESTSSPRRLKKKYDSADDSSQERQKKKEKMKKRHRDTSQESGKSDPAKPRIRVDKKKYRELPEHIKREVDEFEFDNELEFDEELRKLRKESKIKKKVEDVDLSSPEGFNKSNPTVRSRSCSFSKLSRSVTPSKSPDIKTIDIDEKDDIVIDSPDPNPKKNESEEGIPTSTDQNDETKSLQASERNGNKKPVDSVLPSNIEKPDVVKLDNGEVSSTLIPTTVEENGAKPTNAKPKKKTKIIKKKVIRIIKVARKKQKPTGTTDAPSTNTPDTPTEVLVTAGTPTSTETPTATGTTTVAGTPTDAGTPTSLGTPTATQTPVATATPETIEVLDETVGEVEKDENEEAAKSEQNDSVMEVPSPESKEDVSAFDNNSIIITDQPLPENSRWETSGKTIQSSVSVHRTKSNELQRSSSPVKKPKTLNIDGATLPDKTEKKKSRKDHSERAAEKTDGTKVKSTISKEKMLALKQMHAHKSKVLSAEARAKKEADKRAFIEKAKRASMEKAKSDGKESNTDDDERRRRREKYFLLKQRRAKERALAERQRAKKTESESDTVKSKVKTRKSDTDHGDDPITIDEDNCIQVDKKIDQGYKPADAKLKSISEITKKRLQQSEVGEPKKNEIEDEASDVLKSKVTSLKTVIAAAEKRRVIKTSVSEEERELTTPLVPEEHHVRRIVKIDDRKKSLVSKVEKLATATEKSITIRPDHEKRRHREEEMERRRREKSLEREREEAIERDRYERRVRIREEDSLRREMKEKIRLREVEKDRQQREKEEQQRVKSLEKEKLEGLERERQALKEKEKLERKLKRERQLREEMVREKEEKDEKDRKKKEEVDKKRQDKRKVTITNNSDSGNSAEQSKNKRGKRDKTKPGYIIQIIDSDKSDSDSDSSEDEDREKKKKKRNKRKREKKKKKKKTDENKAEEKDDSDDSSEEEEERKKKKKKKEESDASSDDDEDRKKKKRKKHKRKHKKHRKVKKTKKKSKKKKAKKEKSESESEDKQVEQSGEEDSGEESATESTKETKSSSSSDGESAASSSDEKREDTVESSSKTEDVSAEGEGRAHSKEKSDEPREEQPKGKTESPKPERDTRVKEIPEVTRSERDTSRSERDTSRPERDTSRPERDPSRPERDPSRPERDTSRPERDTSRPERDNSRLERDTFRSERDSRSKEKSGTPRVERDNRPKEKFDSVRSERDIRNRDKTEIVKTERDARSKEKSETPRTERDNRNVEKSAENQAERDTKARTKSRDSQLKRESRSKSKSEELRPERDVKPKGKSEERRPERTPATSGKKESSNDRFPTSSKLEDSKAERIHSVSPQRTSKRNDTTADDLELDYNEDIGDLDDDVLYGDLDFADDEQTNPGVSADSKSKPKKKSDDFEDGEILEEELFSAARKEKKVSEAFENNDSLETETEREESNRLVDKNENDMNSTEQNDIEMAIENAVDDAINELSLEIEGDSEIDDSPKLKRTKSNEDGTTQVPKRVLRKR